VSPIRCLDCKTRFVASTLILEDLRFARCPHCYRMDLNGWTGKTYTPPFLMMGLKIALGARRLRCEYCRFNFASFRRRKEVFTFKRWEKIDAGRLRAESRAQKAELRAQTEGTTLVADLTLKMDAGDRGDRH
jgi:DNA-directed RNA polymerase subunit RPC12/RpoP